MQTIDESLFLEFAEALNGELAVLNATVRIEPRRPDGDMMMLIDEAGRPLGEVPDHADAATLLAFELILRSELSRCAS